jgi:hypothetical protein
VQLYEKIVLKLPGTWYRLVRDLFTRAKISCEGPEIDLNYFGCLRFAFMSEQQFAKRGKVFEDSDFRL